MTTPKPSVKDRVSAMVRDVLGPPMKAAGFRRAGRVFWRNGPDVCHVAAVQMSRWGSKESSSFSVLLGVYWHYVEQVLENPSLEKMPPLEWHCTFRIDLGGTISSPPRPDWEVTQTSDFDALGQDVWAGMRDYGLPWFEYRSDATRTLEWKRYAKYTGGGHYSVQELVLPAARVVFKVMLGKRREAIADPKRTAANGFHEDAIKLARKLGLPIRGILGKRDD